MAILGPLISRWLPSQAANIAVKEAGETITVTVANAGVLPSRLLPAGRATACSSTTSGAFTFLLGSCVHAPESWARPATDAHPEERSVRDRRR